MSKLKREWIKRIGVILIACCMIAASEGCGCGETSNTEATEAKATETEGSTETESSASPNGGSSNEGLSNESSSNGGESQKSVDFATPATAGRLQVKGSQLCSANGNPVQLRGVSTHGLGWYPQFVNQNAFNEFRNEWGANVIRLALYTAEGAGYCTGGDSAKLKQLVMDGVEYATKADMYVIIDWHILSDNNPNTYKSQAIAFFDEMSKKYAGNNNVLYEICNEPNGGTNWSDIKSYANDVIPVIRANDPNAVIIVGTPTWSQEVDKAVADPITGYDNIMYTLHFYAATHKDDLRNKMVSAAQAGLPIFVTEFGICDASGNGQIDEASANEWVRVMNQNGISYVCWNLSNKNESSAIFKESCKKSYGFTNEDLNQEGVWLKELLQGANDFTPSTSQPSESSGGEPAPASESQAPSMTEFHEGDVAVTAAEVNSWESGEGMCYQYTCQVANVSGNAIGRWEVTLNFSAPITLSNSWNGLYEVRGNQLIICSTDYNGSISQGGSVNDIGFIVCGGNLAN